MLLNVAFSELKMKKGKVVLTNRGSILRPCRLSSCQLEALLRLSRNRTFVFDWLIVDFLLIRSFVTPKV